MPLEPLIFWHLRHSGTDRPHRSLSRPKRGDGRNRESGPSITPPWLALRITGSVPPIGRDTLVAPRVRPPQRGLTRTADLPAVFPSVTSSHPHQSSPDGGMRVPRVRRQRSA